MLKKSYNVINVEGYLNKKEFKYDVDKTGREYISGTLEIRLNDTDIVPIEVFSRKFKDDGTENKIYKGLETIDETTFDATEVNHYTEASKVSVTGGEIKINEFVNQEGEVVSSVKYSTNFVNRVIDESKFIPRAEFHLEMILKNFRPEIRNEEETGNGYIDGWVIDYQNNLRPIYLHAEGKTFDVIQNNLELNSMYIFRGRIKNSVFTRTIVEESIIGDNYERVIEYSVKQRLVDKVGESKTELEDDDIANGLVQRQKYVQSLLDSNMLVGSNISMSDLPF